MMLAAGLVLPQRLPVAMKAQQGKVVALAALDGIRNGRPADHEALVQHAGEVLERLELLRKRRLVRLGDVRAEFEEDWGLQGVSRWLCDAAAVGLGETDQCE